MHLVSVVIPIYNMEKYLSRCLDSVICQTYNNLEIIVIDDGSTDDSCAVANEYAEKDGRIRVLQMEHMGITPIRKKGVQAATGEYLAFVDGDDWMEPDCIEIRMQNIGDADVLLSGYVTEPEGHIYQQPLDEGYYSAERLTVVRERLFGGAVAASYEELILATLWNNLFKTQMVKDIIIDVPDSLSIGEDLVIVCLAVLASERVCVKKAAAYHYCIRENSLCRGDMPNILMDIALVYDCLRNVLRKQPQMESLLSGLCQYVCMWLDHADIPRALGYPECRRWYYPYYGRLHGKRIVLYGAGEVGKSFYRQIKHYKENVIVAWVDKEHEKYRALGLPVFPVGQIENMEYDFILIAVYKESTAEKIMCELENMGVIRNKLLWNKTHV